MGPIIRLSRDFTRSAKPALEKQTSQLSPVMQQCMDSARVWLLAGPIKCNWPSVTLWSVFQYPVTYVPSYCIKLYVYIDTAAFGMTS